jgi:hypothetical protein
MRRSYEPGKIRSTVAKCVAKGWEVEEEDSLTALNSATFSLLELTHKHVLSCRVIFFDPDIPHIHDPNG